MQDTMDGLQHTIDRQNGEIKMMQDTIDRQSDQIDELKRRLGDRWANTYERTEHRGLFAPGRRGGRGGRGGFTGSSGF